MKPIAYVIVLLLLCASVLAEVTIEMPNEAVAGEPFRLRLLLDNPKLMELVKRISIEHTFASMYFKRIGGDSNTNFPYNGEKEISFDVAVMDEAYYYSENYIYEITFLFWGDSTVIASVSRNISITPVTFFVSTPSVPGELIKNDWGQPDIEAMLFSFYNSDRNADLLSYHGSFGRQACLDPPCIGTPKQDGLRNAKEFTGSAECCGGEGIYYAYVIPFDNGRDGKTNVNIRYNYDITKGIIRHTGSVDKTIRVEDPESVGADAVNELDNVVRSIKYMPGSPIGGNHKSIFSSSIKSEARPANTSTNVWGTVSDTLGNPMPYMMLYLDTDDKKSFTGFTDANGDFSIALSGIPEKGEVPFTLFARWSYNRSDKTIFAIYTLEGNSYKRVYAGRDYKITDAQPLEVHLKLGAGAGREYSSNLASVNDIKSYAAMYYHFHEAVEFALTKLKANIDYRLPVNVLVGNTERNTWYESANQRIRIHSGDYHLGSANRPMNREWHEFAHHVMYSQYGGDFPAGRSVEGTVPHDGFMNPNTGDSFTEGFAEFIAMAIAQDIGKPNPSQYANFGDLENNMKPWDWQGRGEEFAVAGVLWDLIDKDNEEGDGLTLTLDDVWNILKDKRSDFSEVYTELKNRYPRRLQEINALFAAHGFFVNPTAGNKRHDIFEGFRDVNKNSQFDAGEFYVDYGCQNSTAHIVYQPSMSIGRAASYERLVRTSAAMLPGAFLAVKNKEVRLFKITVTPKKGEPYSYDSDLRGGRIYVSPPTMDATVTITADSKDYSTGSPYVITSNELLNKVFASTDTFDTHDFKLKPTGTKLDPEYVLPYDEPSFGTDEGMENPSQVILEDGTGENRMGKGENRGGGSGWILLVGIVVVAAVALVYILRKKK